MKKAIVGILVILAAAFVVAGCGETDTPSSIQEDQASTEEIVSTLRDVVGFPDVKDSMELRNLKERYELLDDPNKVGYVYLIDHGLIITNYTIKGKVSSLNSQFTNPDQVVKADYGEGWESNIVAQAEPDGSYGANPEGIFFFTTDGKYVEWGGTYLYSDKELALTQPPTLQVNATASK